MEEREGIDAIKKANNLIKKFKSKFLHIICSYHPGDLQGELKGK